jgi:transcriptional regulator with XRE-family HTH domain
MDFNFGKKISDLRTGMNLNQGDFANKLGISQASLSNYEKGVRTPDVQFIYRLFKTFAVNPMWFFQNDESMDQDIYTMFNSAVENSKEYKTTNILKDNINNFIDDEKAIKTFSSKLRSIKGIDFISKLAEATHGRGERMSVILYKFLDHIDKTFSKNDLQNVTKADFINMLKNFKITGVHSHLFSENDKKRLIDWVNDEVDDVECYMILSNISIISNVVKSELNVLNKFTV